MNNCSVDLSTLRKKAMIQRGVKEYEQIIYRLAGPAVFRGRLRRFGKCTNGVALSKGTPNLASVRLTL